MRKCIKCGGQISRWLVDRFNKLQDRLLEKYPERKRREGPHVCEGCLGRVLGLLDPPGRSRR